MHPTIPLSFERRPESEMLSRAREFHDAMRRRRTTRQFSADPVPREAIEWAIRVAGTAPSGAHQQPWTFVAISDPELKRRIREAAEREEHEFYHGRAPGEWLEALAPLGTDEHKTHLTDAPWVVVLFRQAYGLRPDGSKRTHYYSQESCGIAAGFFIAAVHMMGLATLTHTPNPMGFLGELLGRPSNEKAMLVMPVGIRRRARGSLISSGRSSRQSPSSRELDTRRLEAGAMMPARHQPSTLRCYRRSGPPRKSSVETTYAVPPGARRTPQNTAASNAGCR